MSVWFKHLAGTTDGFALEITFHDDPDGADPNDPVTASWGSFRLFANGCEPTVLVGPDDQPASPTWYLLPMLEWAVANWDPLLHEARFPVSPRGELPSSAAEYLQATYLPEAGGAPLWRYFERHALASARLGGIFPNVVFRRIADSMEISWEESSRPGGGPARFVQTSGRELVPVDVFAAAWFKVLDEAASALQERCGEAARVLKLRAAVSGLKSPGGERQSLRAAWLQGFREDPNETLRVWDDLAGKGIPGPAPRAFPLYASATLPSVLFASLNPNLTEADVAKVIGLRSATTPMSDPLRKLVRAEPCPVRAFQSGYDLALDVRAELGLADAPIDIKAVLADLGLPVASLQIEAGKEIRALSLVDGDAAVVACNESAPQSHRPWSRAAVLAHELCHLLFDRNLGSSLAIASGPWAERRVEQRANAFAVMFLMPREGVRQVVEQAGSDPKERVRAVARKYGTSFRATSQHLFSLELLDEGQRNEVLAWLDELADAERL